MQSTEILRESWFPPRLERDQHVTYDAPEQELEPFTYVLGGARGGSDYGRLLTQKTRHGRHLGGPAGALLPHGSARATRCGRGAETQRSQRATQREQRARGRDHCAVYAVLQARRREREVCVSVSTPVFAHTLCGCVPGARLCGLELALRLDGGTERDAHMHRVQRCTDGEISRANPPPTHTVHLSLSPALSASSRLLLPSTPTLF